MFYLNLIFLPVVFLIGVVTAYEDFKYGKIRNRWIKLGLFYALLVYLSLVIWNFIGGPISLYYYDEIKNIAANEPHPIFRLHYDYLLLLLLNSALAVVLGFILWRKKIIAAGDAKLFFVYSLLIPTGNYWQNYLPIFPSILLLLNCFTVILMFILFRVAIFYLLKFFRLKQVKNINIKNLSWEYFASKIKNYQNSFQIMIIFFTLNIIFDYISFINIELYRNYFYISLLAVFIVFRNSFDDFMKKYHGYKINIIILIILYFYNLFFGDKNILADFLEYLPVMLIFIIIFNFLSKILNCYASFWGITKIKTGLLNAGMVLSQPSLDRLWPEKPYQNSYDNLILDRGQASHIRKIAQEKNIQELEINNPFHFALWLLGGVIITLILQGSLINRFLEIIN